MKRFVLRISIAAAAFSVGVALANTYRPNKTPTISPIAMPITELRLGTDCFPGKSKEFTAASTSSYFPRGLLSQNEWGDQFKTEWYSKHLRAMEEAPLSFPDKQTLESYRFLWLRSFHHPVAVRLWKTETDQFISVKELSGAGGYEPGTFILKSQRKLSQAEWDAFMRVLEYSCYWEQPTEEDDAGLDGARWILEGFRQSRYHAVDRWTPQSGSFREACLYMLKLSRLKIDKKTEPLY